MRPLFISLAKNLLVLVLVISLLTFGIWGLLSPNTNADTFIGNYRIFPSQVGLSLYQKGQPDFYNFSPFNDFLSNDSNHYQSLITKADITSNNYRQLTHPSPLVQKLDTLLSLVNFNSPRLSFLKDNTKINYSITRQGNRLLVTQDLSNYPLSPDFTHLTSTLSVQCHDLIFDQNLNLITPTDDQTLDNLQQFYSLSLAPAPLPHTDSPWLPVTADHLYILNPTLPGLIKITRAPGQQFVHNPSYCLLGLQTPLTSPPKNSINLSLLSSPDQLKP